MSECYIRPSFLGISFFFFFYLQSIIFLLNIVFHIFSSFLIFLGIFDLFLYIFYFISILFLFFFTFSLAYSPPCTQRLKISIVTGK
jgi:hypothetical protein